MPHRKIAFGEMAWTQGGHPLERKKSDGSVTMLEFAVGFEDPNWCERSHVGLVLSGEFSLRFEDGDVAYAAGDCFVVDAGVRHRAWNAGEVATTLFVVSG